MTFKREIGEIYRLKVPFMSVYTSVFLIKTEIGNILIDCATTDEDVDEIILPALKEFGLCIADVKYLVLTHNHSDHAGGKGRLLRHNSEIQVITSVTKISDEIEIYPLKGHTFDFIGVMDLRNGTLISGDGLQGAGIGMFRCSLETKEEYLESIEKIRKDERVKNVLFSHAYEPWYKDGLFGRDEVEKCLQDCIECIKGE